MELLRPGVWRLKLQARQEPEELEPLQLRVQEAVPGWERPWELPAPRAA